MMNLARNGLNMTLGVLKHIYTMETINLKLFQES